MIFKYGDYSHSQAECSVRTELVSVFDQYQRRIGTRIRYTVLGVKRGTSQADLTTKLNALAAAYNTDGNSFGLYLDDGSTATNMVVADSNVFGQTRVVVPPSMISGPWSGRPEYANQKTYYLVLEAETRVGEGYFAWKSRIVRKGTGGPKWVYSPQQDGDAQKQTLQTATTVWFIQTGAAIGRKAYVTPDSPQYPTNEHEEMREVGYDSATDIRFPAEAGDVEMFGCDWKYFMEATTGLTFSAFTLPAL